MKLFEVLQPLLESKVDHITTNQGHKIIQRAKRDRSVTDPNPDAHELVQFMVDNISKKYLQWVVNRYLQGDFLLNEDYQVLQEVLTKYQQFQQAIGPLKKTITVADLYKLLEPYQELNIDDEKERNLITSGQAEIVFQQGNERVIIPHTYVASEYFAKDKWGTEWCTRYDKQYEEYSKKGPLYMIDINDGEEVYQAHWESGEGIKDRWDKEPEDMEALNRSAAIGWVIERGKEQIENMKTGNLSLAAYVMVRYGLTNDIEWAMRIIENDKTGNSSGAAYAMVEDGHTKPEWAMRVIENAETGNPSWAAYWMVKYGPAEPQWAMRVIENAKTGDPSHFAYRMVRDGYATQEWYEKNFK